MKVVTRTCSRWELSLISLRRLIVTEAWNIYSVFNLWRVWSGLCCEIGRRSLGSVSVNKNLFQNDGKSILLILIPSGPVSYDNLCITAVCALTVRPRVGRGNSLIKVTGMLVVSLSSVNCRFRSQLGCLGSERHHTCPFRYRLGLCQKKFTKNTVMCFGGQFKL